MNDDMDELYRRAAEDYPLNTNSADWNKVVEKISAKDPVKKNVRDNNKKYKRSLLLLLLLPLAWLGKEYLYGPNGQSNNSVTEQVTEENLPSSRPGNVVLEKNTQPSGPIPAIAGDQNAPVHLVDHRSVKTKIITPGLLVQTITGADIGGKEDNPIAAIQTNENKEQVTTANEVVTIGQKNNDQSISTATTTLPDGNKSETGKTAARNKDQKQKEQGLYAGIVVSPDVSSVKFQSVKHTGLSLGLLIGYQVNKKLSVESGLAWSKKYYYSDGKHFNAKNITLLPYAKVKELDGVCEMIEVPVTIRYNVSSSSKSKLSVSGGMSSYIMKDENYDYTIERYGQQYPRNADYKNSSTDLFAVINAGVAYERSLGNGAALRLEPYIKIPLKGIGIGSLPIMSTGINIALTKKLFK